MSKRTYVTNNKRNANTKKNTSVDVTENLSQDEGTVNQ